MSELFFFLFFSFSGEVVKIGGFATLEACESYRAKVVMRQGSTTEKCREGKSKKAKGKKGRDGYLA